MSLGTSHVDPVLGGGEAGKSIAWELAQQGQPVVVIERSYPNGKGARPLGLIP